MEEKLHVGLESNGGKIMSQELYYTAPSEKAFEDMKKCAIELWNTYDNTYGYVDEKVNAIKDLKNVGDNFMYIFAMFDSVNQIKVSCMLKDYTIKELAMRLEE